MITKVILYILNARYIFKVAKGVVQITTFSVCNVYL